jgi:VanZ family protein
MVFLSLWPEPPHLLDFQQGDIFTHVIAYMTLMLWFANIYSQTSYRLSLGIGFFTMGICLELLQGKSGYRAFSYADMLANGLGILLALYLAKTRLANMLLRFDTWLLSLG